MKLVHASIVAVSAGIAAAQDCECYVTNGTVPEYFASHLFLDYRNLSQYAASPNRTGVTEDDAAEANVTSPFFSSDDWTKHWTIQTWDNSRGAGQGFSNDATVHMINSAANIYIEADDSSSTNQTFLTMRTSRLDDFQTAAEVEATSYNYQFLSLRVKARIVGSGGAVAGIFTYRNSSDPAKVQEADIEVLTRDPPQYIQYTNQPSDLPDVGTITEATRNVSLPGGVKYSDWAVHRVDWTPERSVWYVDGTEVANIAFQVPKDPSGINFNMWSDGGSWSGNMTKGGDASLQIQWIEMVFNATDSKSKRSYAPRASLEARASKKGGVCHVVCSLDDQSAQPGNAKVLSISSGASATVASIWAPPILSAVLALALAL